MQKIQYRIEKNETIACDSFRMVLGTDTPVPICSGQFVDIAIEGTYLRRPISVCDAHDGKLTLIYKVVGKGTAIMSRMFCGMDLELLAPLGHGFSHDRCREAALLVGGGLGAAPLHLLARELCAVGTAVTAVLGFNKKDDIVLLDEYRKLGIEPLVATMDGSYGVKGLVTDVIHQADPQFDYFYTCGPMVMMKAVCTSLEQSGEASLEERMGCGAGFCYGCSIMTTAGPRTVCHDGPVFRKEDILW